MSDIIPLNRSAMHRTDWRIAIFLAVLLAVTYFATAAGITSSNDGSHYALLRALVDQGSFEISDYLSFTEGLDYALLGDRRYSDRPPGTAFLATPLYAFSAELPSPPQPMPSKHDPDNPRLAYALLTPALLTAGAAALLFMVLRGHFSLSRPTGVLTTLGFGLGSMAWKYGSVLYSHAASGAVVLLTLALVLRWRGRAWPTQRAALAANLGLGALLGSSILMEYTNIVFIALVGVYWVWHIGRAGRSGRWSAAAFFVAGGALPGLLLMGYNTLNFGGPLELSTFHVDISRWPQNASFFSDFATPLRVGLPAMLFYGSDNQGLFWLAPITLAGLAGVSELWRRSRGEWGLIVGVFAVMLTLFSASTTFNPYTNDGRYLTPFLGVWFMLVGFGVERGLRSTWGTGVVYGLLFLSMRNQFWHIAFAWGHGLDVAQLRPWSFAPDNILRVAGAVWPNAANALWLGAALVGMWGLGEAVGWLVRRRRVRARAA